MFFLKQNIKCQQIAIQSAPIELVYVAYNELKCGKSPNYAKFNNPHVAADILKIFYAKLPEPLIPYEFTIAFSLMVFSRTLSTIRRSDHEIGDDLEYFAYKIVKRLPELNRINLLNLLRFLSLISQEPANGVNAEMLARNFAPIIIRPKWLAQQGDILEESMLIMEFLIENI